MLVLDDTHEASAAFQLLDERGIGVFDELPAVRRVDEGRVGPDRVEHREAFAFGDLAVDLAEGGGEVHEAGPVVDGHELVGDDPRRRRRCRGGGRSNGRS